MELLLTLVLHIHSVVLHDMVHVQGWAWTSRTYRRCKSIDVFVFSLLANIFDCALTANRRMRRWTGLLKTVHVYGNQGKTIGQGRKILILLKTSSTFRWKWKWSPPNHLDEEFGVEVYFVKGEGEAIWEIVEIRFKMIRIELNAAPEIERRGGDPSSKSGH